MRELLPLVLLISLACLLSHPVEAQELFSKPLLTPVNPNAMYGKFWFPEPLRGPEMDVDNELRLDWFHAERLHLRSDEVKAELEKSFGLLTLEAEAPYQRDEETARDPLTGRQTRSRAEGIGKIELSARYPLYQFVSPGNDFEYTVVGAFELALPSGSSISHATELVPQLFQLARLGRHVSLQTSVGCSSLIGPDEGGVNTLEYSAVLGYSID